MNPLREYAQRKRGNLAELARKVGVTYQYLLVVSYGRGRASVELAEAIEKATDGQVKAVELVFWKSETARVGS